MTGSIKPFDR